jgi:hypothetical protein
MRLLTPATSSGFEFLILSILVLTLKCFPKTRKFADGGIETIIDIEINTVNA